MFSFDKDFVQKLIKKDQSTFDAFYVKSVDVFYRYIKSRYKIGEGDIQDLLSDVYLKIWSALEKFDEKYSFEGYVWTILKNTLKDYFKKSKSMSFSTYEEYNEIPMEEVLMSDDDVAEAFQKTYLREDIQSVIETLDQDSQDILHFRYVEQRSYDEISIVMGVSSQNLRKKLSRAVSTLRNLLEKKQKL